MRTLKHLVILSLVAFVAVFVAAPSALAKKALSEDEMDLITAAGQPKIIQTGTGEITFFDGPVNSLILGTDSQSSLHLGRAMGGTQWGRPAHDWLCGC
jgi:hypothetical protein